MRVQVTIGVQAPEKVNTAIVTAELPRGYAEVTVVRGGLNVHHPDFGHYHPCLVATAAVEAYGADRCGGLGALRSRLNRG